MVSQQYPKPRRGTRPRSSRVDLSAPNRGARSGSDDLLGDLVAKARQGARGETGARELLERETEMRKLSKKSKAIIATAAIIGLAGSGAAYAYWTTIGNGTGSAATGTSSAFVVTTDAATGGLLTPGGPTDTVAFHVQNNNSGVQRLTAVTVTVANATGTPWVAVPGCSAADYTVGTPSFTAGNIAPTATLSGTVTITMNNNLTASQDSCKGVTVPLYVAAS